jgi:hypothetical protein
MIDSSSSEWTVASGKKKTFKHNKYNNNNSCKLSNGIFFDAVSSNGENENNNVQERIAKLTQLVNKRV